MSTRACRRFEHRREMDDAAWREHVIHCRECAEEERAHQILRTILAEPAPRLSSDFHRRVVSEARRRRRQASSGSVWRRRAMAGYWLAAASASYVVLSLSWPERLDPTDWIVIVGVVLTVALPAVLLRTLLRADLVELWFRTLE